MKKLVIALIAFAYVHSIDATIYHYPKNYDQVGYCCYRQEGTYEPQTIRWADDFANEWPRRGVTNEGKVGFADVSEQPLISGFERSVYNTPK